MNDSGYLHNELVEEQAVVDTLYDRLDTVRAEARVKLDAALRADYADNPQGLGDRDAIVRHYEEKLISLDKVDERLCFGRLDLRDSTRLYIGRVGLADEENQPLLIDWRAPIAAAFYQATAAAPGEVVLRRHLTTHGRQVVSVEDDVLDLAALDDADRRHLVGEGALLAAVQAARTGRLGDIVATIQAEQDKVIRDELRGILVVQGGPGTGKTVVALHRTAYLLYTHRDKLSRSGVLLVGPSPVFLRYIERVLPSLGETGVVMATPGTLFPGVRTVLEDEPAASRLKGDIRMALVLEQAVRLEQRIPKAPVVLNVEGHRLAIEPSAFKDARRKARASGGHHNAARPVFIRQLVGHMVERLAAEVSPGERLTALLKANLMAELLDSPDLEPAIEGAWPQLTAERLLADLYGNPELLAAAAPHLSAEEQRLLHRAPDDVQRWTVSDVPLLDEAAEILGVDDTAERFASRQAAHQRLHEVEYARGALQMAGGYAAAFLSAEKLADRARDLGPQRTVAERAADDRRWAFGHIVVDEAQELSAMAWRLLMRRCPTRSMTLVGDIAQTGSVAGANAWSEVLSPYVADRWRLSELTTNYRTPAAVMSVAESVLRAAGITARTPLSVREGETPTALALSDGGSLVDLVRREFEALGEGRMAVVASSTGAWSVDGIAGLLEAALPAGSVAHGANAIDAPVAVLDPRQAKGLEVDVVVLVEPADILAASPRGANDLYVAITRPTQRLVVGHAQALPQGMESLDRVQPEGMG